MEERHKLNIAAIRNLVRETLAEDVGSGDATTLSVVPERAFIRADIITREDCVVSGLPVVETIFEELDDRVAIDTLVEDGQRCAAGEIIASLTGPAQAILTGERTALNFLQRLSGIATTTRQYVSALGPHSSTRVLDTRKTTPGLRLLEKYAVHCGGGTNHRFGLYDRVMIKDNHRAIAALEGPGGIRRAVEAARAAYPNLEIEVETDDLEQVQEALDAHADYILLDNMDNEELAAAITLRDQSHSKSLLEVSGGVTLERMPSLAKLNVDFISVGALTHSVRSIDIGLDIPEDAPYPG